MSEFLPKKGDLVIGGMLVLLGVAILLERTGAFVWSGMWTLWPFIVFGIGLARFVQSEPGGPKQGLIFMCGGAWLLAVEGGWISAADSWPVLIILVGLIIAFNSGKRRHWPHGEPGEDGRPHRRRHFERPLSGLGVLGIWIAVVVGVQMSGMRSFGQPFTGQPFANTATSDSDRVQLFSMMGRSEHTSRATAFHGGNVTNVMGRSVIDLRSATIAPGAEASIDVFSMMGAVVVRVPAGWTVDTGALSAMGAVRDQRFPSTTTEAAPSTGPPPRLVIRGAVLMGRLSIES